jgi:hypothetical protein
MYGRVWLNKASGVILDRVPLGLMAGIHSPEVLPFNALGQDVDAEDMQDMAVRWDLCWRRNAGGCGT